MRVPRRFYLLASIVGALIPWYFFAQFIGEHGLNVPLFIESLFVNGAAAGFAVDLLISITVFWVWSYADARKRGVRHWWVLVPAGLFIGLSLVIPLYFYLREGVE